MITVLQWLALAICVLCTLWRLPAARHGRNVSLCWCFGLCSIALGLSLPQIYLPVDAVLGGRNFANLVLRLIVYAIFFLLALKLAAAYRSPRAASLIRGPVGASVLSLFIAGTVALFLASDLPQSRTGLAGYQQGQETVRYYALLGRVYPAYVAACLLLPTWRAARSAATALNRTASATIFTALLLVAASAPLLVLALPTTFPLALLTYLAVLLMALGLTLVWISARSQSKLLARNPLMRQ
ncbi:MAG: hypothetical protein ACHP7K_04960 [Actinomycetales bacterium]